MESWAGLRTKEVAKIVTGARVRKLFSAGWFSGVVNSVTRNLKEADGSTYHGHLFHIKYEDDDHEHMTVEQLLEVLQDRASIESAVQAALAAKAAEQAAAAAADGENGGGWGQEQQEQRRPAKKPKVPLQDATRQHNAFAATDRRSKREPKRKQDEDFEYTEQPGAKRAAQGSAAAAQPNRTPAARVALAQQTRASASEEEVPLAVDGTRQVGLPGHVKHIELIDFMCHHHLQMDFGLFVNFISGTNGSGKSALLQALQCCLGVKANQTGRGAKYSSFVRTGCDEAVVRVSLHNRPYKDRDAFQHAVYGDVIVVERKISAAGPANFALKDASGRVHSKKKDDVEAMLHTLGLNAANPIAVMTQDTARSFLAGSSRKADEEKYELFMEATQLDTVIYNHELARERIRLMDERVSALREQYEEIRGEQARLQQSVAALQGLAEHKEDRDALSCVLAWLGVDGWRERLQKLEQEAATLPAQAEAVQQRIEEAQRQHSALEERARDQAAFLDSFNQRSQALLEEARELDRAHKAAHRQLREAERRLQALQAQHSERATQKQSLEETLQEQANDQQQQSQAVFAEYQQQLEQARTAAAAAQADARSQDAAYQEAAAAQRAAAEHEEALRRSLLGAQGEAQSLQQSLEGLRSAARNKKAMFGGAAVVRLLSAIQRSRAQFHQAPIGPIGAHLTLSDSRWGTAVEAALGFSLNNFLVTDLHDARVMRRLIDDAWGRQAGFRPSVTVYPFHLPAYTVPESRQPHGDIATIYRLLQSDNHLVINVLLDTARIERTALAQTPEACKRCAWDTANVSACFAVDGSKFYRRGNSCVSLPPAHWLARQPARLGQSAAQQTQELQERLQQVQQGVADLQRAHAEVQQRVAAAAAHESELRKLLSRQKQNEYQAMQALSGLLSAPPLEVMMTQAQAEGEGAEEIQGRIVAATQAMCNLEQQMQEAETEIQAARAAQSESFQQHLAKRAGQARLAEENEQLLGSMGSTQAAAAAAAQRVQALQAELQRLQGAQPAKESEVQEIREAVEQWTRTAEGMCSREEALALRERFSARRLRPKGLTEEQVASFFTGARLQKKIESLGRKIAASEREAGGSLEDLQAELQAATRRMQGEGARARQCLITFELLNESCAARKRKLHQLMESVEQLSNRKFAHYMSKKGHMGALKISHKERTLQLKVQIGRKGAADAAAVKDLKQLSGGERSYTTVAFTLALGSLTDMPFRAMDEYDVFMDSVNRRVAMENLFSFAYQGSHLQFIFLTPQDVAAVEVAKQGAERQLGRSLPQHFVHVVQMRPARANATHA